MQFATEVGVSHARGTTAVATRCQRLVRECRSRVAELLGAASPDDVIYTAGGTDGLNLVIRGLLRAGDRVVASQVDHNAVLRPLYASPGEEVIVPATRQGMIDIDAWADACRLRPPLACINHASNVTGSIQPVAELAAIAKRSGACVLLDACQTAGTLDCDWSALGVDWIATGVHKGLLGPLGLGLLVRMTADAPLPEPLRYGGTGVRSESPEQPSELPDRLEAGSLNTPAIAGLLAALDELPKHATPNLADLDAALDVDGIEVFSPGEPRVPTRAFAMRGISAGDAAAVFESSFGVECRAGLHCAPLMHEALGSPEGGLVRVSFGRTSTDADVATVSAAVRELHSQLGPLTRPATTAVGS